MWRSLFSSRCEEWEKSFECRKALVEVQMAKMAAEAERRAAEAEKMAEVWELKAIESLRMVDGERVKRLQAERRATEAVKRATEAKEMAESALINAEKMAEVWELRAIESLRMVDGERVKTIRAVKRAEDAEKRAAEAEEMAESNGICFEDFMCPITSALMEDPVVDRDGNSYERKSIEMWLMSNRTSPITRLPLNVEELVPNRALRNAIEVARKVGNVEKP